MYNFKKLTVEEAKHEYHASRNSAGRDFVQIIIMKDGHLGWVSKSKWSDKEDIAKDMAEIENADALYCGGYL